MPCEHCGMPEEECTCAAEDVQELLGKLIKEGNPDRMTREELDALRISAIHTEALIAILEGFEGDRGCDPQAAGLLQAATLLLAELKQHLTKEEFTEAFAWLVVELRRVGGGS